MLHTPSLEEVLRSTLDPAPAHAPAPGDRLAAVLAPVVESPGPPRSSRSAPTRSPVTRERCRSRAGSWTRGNRSPTPRAGRRSRRSASTPPSRGLSERCPRYIRTSPRSSWSRSWLSSDRRRTCSPRRPRSRYIRVDLARLATIEEPMELPRADGTMWTGWAYPVDDHRVWGATGLMVHSFLEVLRPEAPWALS